MIHSETRSLLTDALTPPPGCLFDGGIATTFSLDLVTLLGLPLHLAWLGDARAKTGELDPIAAMEALRRTAGQLTIFCQRGRMQIPRIASPLLGLLEGMVHEVTAPHGGAFHPKVWLLKFVSSSGETHMRLLVLSRNLTDDCSWDISLRLDGTVGRKALPSNKPLLTLLSKSIDLSHKPMTSGRTEGVQRLIDEMMRSEWALPAGFEGMRFHTLGLGKRPVEWWPLPAAGYWDELGVISPFIGQEALARLAGLTEKKPYLVTRAEEIDALPATAVGGYESVWVMDDRAESTDKEEAVPGRERGLHAKVFVGKRGWDTHLFVGSANASTAALVAGRNVEFMVELIGKGSKAGRPADWLTEDGIRPLLAPYERTESNEDTEELKLEKRLEEVRDSLCAAGLSLRCAADENGWSLDLVGLDCVDMRDVKARVWPVTVRSDGAIDISDAPPSRRLGVYAIQDITSFVGFTLVIGKYELCFALALPLDDAPPDREIAMLRAVVRDRDGFVRYLLLLLGDWEEVSGAETGAGTGAANRFLADGLPMFEMLAKAYARDPDRLARVAQVVKRLQKETDGQNDDILSLEFMDIWQCFENALSAQESK